MSDENQKIQSIRGMHDILPDDHCYHTLIKKVVRHRFRQAGFRRITTPILEETKLFERSLGETSDAASKEMYRVQVGDHVYGMKPEGTAGVCRSYVEHGMSSWSQPVELYYIEPHFRHDRPQKGRFRQFWQFGGEVLGARDASIDAQLIHLMYKILEDIGIAKKFTLHINTIGSATSRKKYEEALKDFYLPKMRNLCFNCQDRVEKNPLRLLDCKEEDCKILAGMAPKFQDYLDDESREYYEKLKMYLDAVGLEYQETPTLVRGLDYYCDTVFEFVDSDGLSVAGGGRYDGLVEQLGGVPTPGMGFAAGMERIIMHMKEAGIKPPQKDEVHVYVACLGDAAKARAMKLLSDLHDAGVHAVGAIGKPSIKNQLQKADKLKVEWTLLLGEVEVKEGIVILKNMQEGSQKRVPIDGIVDVVKELVGEENLDLI